MNTFQSADASCSTASFGDPIIKSVVRAAEFQKMRWDTRSEWRVEYAMPIGPLVTSARNRDIPQIGVDIYTPDFQAIARGFGCNALKAESLAHLKDALRQAVKADRPTVVEIEDAAAQNW